jgi:hypothetical protein
MTNRNKKANGLWVKLSVDFFDDPKILEAGVEAELLFVRGLAWAKRDNSGFVPRGALIRLGLGLVDCGAAVDRLVHYDLWHEVSDGYEILAWSSWQVDAEVLSRRAGAGSLGMHRRWHKGGVVDGCSFCADEYQTDNTCYRSVIPEKEKETALSSQDDFDAFWGRYPKKVAKADARKAWKQTVKSRPDQETLMGCLALACLRWAGTDAKFIPYPATWLRSERWADDIEPSTAAGDEQTLSAGLSRVVEVLAPLRQLGASDDEVAYVLADFDDGARAFGWEFFRTGNIPK